MAATKAQIGYGTLLQKGDGASPENFSTIAEVHDVDGFGFSLEQLEATHMESPNGYKEFVAGLKEGDEITVKGNLTVDNQSVLKTWADAAVRSNWKIDFPGSALSTYTFAATPTGLHFGIAVDGILDYELGMKIAGAIA